MAGKGFYVCEYNTDYLLEKQLMTLEKRLSEIIFDAKAAGLDSEEFISMVKTLYDGE